MAINVVFPILIPLEEDLYNATRLLSGAGAGPLEFTEPRYCAVVSEDAQLTATVTVVLAVHKRGEEVRYTITGGNSDGLFTIDQKTGIITLAATLDHEIHDKHELVVAAEGGGEVVQTLVQVLVADVNDNAPFFLRPNPQVTVIEEDDRDLPLPIAKVEARDFDRLDSQGLLYTIRGDGVDGYTPNDAFFSINSRTGELIQLRALDRDPPNGKGVWKVIVQVKDGQASWKRLEEDQPPHSLTRHPRDPVGGVVGALYYTDTSTRPRPRLKRDNKGIRHGRKGIKTDGGSRYDSRTSGVLGAEFYSGQEDKVSTMGKSAGRRTQSPGGELHYYHEDESKPSSIRVKRSVRTDEEDALSASRPVEASAMSLSQQGRKSLIMDHKNHKDRPSAIEQHSGDDVYSVELDRSRPRDEGERQLLRHKRDGFPPPRLYRPWIRETSAKPRHTRRGVQVTSKSSRTKVRYPREYFPTTKAKYRGKSSTHFQSWLTGRSSAWEERKSQGVLRTHSRYTRAAPLTRSPEASISLVTPREVDGGKDFEHVERYFSNSLNKSLGHVFTSEAFSGRELTRTLKESVREKSENHSGKEEKVVVSFADINQTSSQALKPALRLSSTSSNRKKFVAYHKKYRPHAANSHEIWENLYEENRRHHEYSGASSLVTGSESRGQHLPASIQQSSAVEESEGDSGLHTMDSLYWRAADLLSGLRSSSTTDSDRILRHSSSNNRNMATFVRLSRRSISHIIMNTSHSDAKVTRRRRSAADSPLFANAEFERILSAEEEDDGICENFDVYASGIESFNGTTTSEGVLEGLGRGQRVHMIETVVTVVVKDINDNAPTFPNTTMFGEVQENGPIDLSVAVVSAWDADDATEGTNARLTYSIEKNVIDERTGEAIFAVHPESGLVRTALCCLDRETTPEYNIQVVASDGGGLKGTGTVIVRLADVNDNSPRLARQQWDLKVEETRGDGPPSNATILEITAADRDTANYFYYRVVESSGWGWQHFGIRTVGAVGQLYATQPLDYEDEMHRRGFKFMVQVTDRGRGGWNDPRHLDSAWVSVKLRDLNDNPPRFSSPHDHVTVREDTAPGTILASLPAHDPDMAGKQKVDYRVVGGWGALTVDEDGGVVLWRALDREAPDGDTGVARVIAVDHGRPPLTSTVTLSITVTDVNDCAPRLLPPTVLHVTEGAPPTLLGVLTATDYDVWALGHGPPFNISLAPTNPAHVLTHIKLKFDPHLDSGRGGAQLWTSRAVDREEHPQLLVQVVVADAGSVAATQTVTVIIDDVNDNPMKPASKTVYLWKTQGGGSDAPLGRVYVKDPDDWDLADKSFRWVGSPHPLFSLNTQDGTIFASSQVREGRYELHFSVSDRVWRQRGVSANVTVAVRMLTQEALAHAAPITLMPTTPTDLTRGWTPAHGGGGLGRLVAGVLKVVGEGAHTVEVVSVYGHHAPRRHAPHAHTSSFSTPTITLHEEDDEQLLRAAEPLPPPSACVWVSVRGATGKFMDPVKLQGLLGLHSRQLEEATNLTVLLESSGVIGRRLEDLQDPDLHDLQNGDNGDPSSAASLASTALPLQVVDTNATSLVTPRLTRAHACHAHEPETCTPTSCLNGGRCVRSTDGNRCICPGGSKGWQCKVLARTFSGSGWAWVRPLPPCLPTTISFRLLTRRPNALILYSGPLAPQQRPPAASSSTPTPMLALQVKYGRPQLLFEGGVVPIKLEVNTTVHDGDWHTLHLHLDAQGVALMVDMCGRGWEKQSAHDDAHCLARAAWTTPWGLEGWLGSGPLQVGGLAHTPPTALDHGWAEAPTARPLDGCISHLSLNGQLVDLGEPAYSRESTPGCRPQEEACPGGLGGCSVRGECVGGLRRPECECEPGWTGSGCSTPTVPAALGKASYMKVALSFTPEPRVLRVQLRLRTRGARHGLLLHLAAHHHSAAFTLHLRSSVACASLTGSEWAARVACVEGRPLGDGSWHTVRAERHGDNLVVSVDDGDGWRRNESLVSFLMVRERRGRGKEVPTPLNVDKHDGVTVGGLPEFVGVRLVGVRDDLADACVDDLRVSGRHLPLPPAINGTSWGQVTTLQHLERGCEAPDACVNTSCAQPLTCTTTWGQATCSCGPGRQLVDRACEDVDECLWRPCLHGGSCRNLRPGYLCMCGPGHTGDHCQWATLTNTTNSLTAPVAIAALTVSLLVLLVVGLVVSLRIHRHRTNLGLRERGGDEAAAKSTVVEVKGGTDEGGGGGKGEKKLREDDTHESFLECLKFKLPTSQPALKKKGERSPGGSSQGSPSGAVAPGKSDPAAGGEAGGAPDPLLPRDDLRAYAYEGDGSSSGSFTSTISDLKVEMAEEDSTIIPLVPEFLEVMDLLRNLPEAPNKTSFSRTKSTSLKKGSGSPGYPRDPPPTASSIVMVKGGGSSKPSTVRTRISHVSPSRYKSEGAAAADVMVTKSEGEVSTVC